MGKFIKTDKFGNPYQIVALKKSKKDENFNKGYVELSGKLYKIEVWEPKDDSDEVAYFARVTKTKKPNNGSM